MMIKKIFHWGLIAFMSIVLGLGIYNWNATSLLGSSIPMPLGYGAAVVMSGSMEPTLSVDDMIVIRETCDYDVDDIVVFEEGNIVVVHRVIGIEEGMYITQGDANNVADDPIYEKQIIGEVIFSIPGIGGIVSILKTPVGVISILIVSFLLLEMSYRKEKETGDKTIEELKEEIRRLKEEG